MKAQLIGSHYRVRVSADEVAAFAAQWPCFGPATDLRFDFDAATGDLVDVDGESSAQDGGGLVALADDEMLCGAYDLGLADVLALRQAAPR